MHRFLVLFGALLGGALVSALAWLVLVPQAQPILVLEGYEYPIPNEESERHLADALDLRSKELQNVELSLVVSDEVFLVRAEDIGLQIDRSTALQEARAALASASVSFSDNPRLWLWRRFSQHSEAVSVQLTTRLDEATAKTQLEMLKTGIDREPIDAKLLISEHQVLPSQDGRTLSISATLVRLSALSLKPGLQVEAVISSISPRVSEDDLLPVDVTRVLASFETTYRGHAGPRAINIRTAGRLLNGAVILPGEVLSFNQQVGRRVHGRGFVDAPVIVNDEMELDVGGGVCQVATTLHAAAVYGNLEIVRRRSHSRPSGYAPLGLDATVVDGKVDLRLRNPFDEAILVHVSFPDTYRVRVELLGRDPDAKVQHAYTVTHREPFSRRVWHREEMPPGEFKKKQKGSEGMDVVSVLRIKHDDGRELRRSYRSKYYPVPEVFWMGQGAKTINLPKMPEKAVALIIDGEESEDYGRSTEASSEEDVPTLREADGSNL